METLVTAEHHLRTDSFWYINQLRMNQMRLKNLLRMRFVYFVIPQPFYLPAPLAGHECEAQLVALAAVQPLGVVL
jgi:hypothetical protein